MVFATGANFDLSIQSETVFGTTPPSGTWSQIPVTGFTPNLTKSELRSETLRGDQQLTDVRHGNKTVTGDISFELGPTEFDEMIEGALGGTFTSDILKGGTGQTSFSMEARHNDVNQFRLFSGMLLNGMSLSIAPDAIVTGTFPIVGKNMTISGSEVATPVAFTNFNPFDSFNGTINEGGGAIAIVTALELTTTRGYEPAFVIASDVTPQVVPGRNVVSGTVTAFFENATLLNKFINETTSSLDVTLSNGVDTMKFDMPEIVYTGGDLNIDGEGATEVALPFTAIYSDSDATQIIVTRS
jgi:hypothetical protein